MLYVVRRAFKNYGEVCVPGMVVDPDTIKHFKSRLRDHVIVEVPEKDFDKWNQYFKAKFGVEIQLPEPEPQPEPEPVKPTVVVVAATPKK